MLYIQLTQLSLSFCLFLQDKLESSVVEQASMEARDKATTELIKTLKIAVCTRYTTLLYTTTQYTIYRVPYITHTPSFLLLQPSPGQDESSASASAVVDPEGEPTISKVRLYNPLYNPHIVYIIKYLCLSFSQK